MEKQEGLKADKKDINEILSEKELLEKFAQETAAEIDERRIEQPDLTDAQPGREILIIQGSPPELITKTRIKKAKALLPLIPGVAVEFTVAVTRAKYDTTDLMCNAYAITFVAYIKDEDLPDDIKKRIKN